MTFIETIIVLLFILIILKQLKYMKKLIIPTRKGCVEIITLLLGGGIFIGITYFYGHTSIHYIIGGLGIIMFFSIWAKQGISLEGFLSTYKYKENIIWQEIKKVTVIKSKDVEVKLSGGFREQIFHFKNSDYDKIILLLRENLPKHAILDINLDK